MVNSVSITTGPDLPGMLCVTCFFVSDVKNRFCSVSLEGSAEFTLHFSVFQENGSDSGTECITGLATGIYSIVVCNADCNVNSKSQVAYVYQNLSISGVGVFVMDSCYTHYIVCSQWLWFVPLQSLHHHPTHSVLCTYILWLLCIHQT